jgi:hypothetical protein
MAAQPGQAGESKSRPLCRVNPHASTARHPQVGETAAGRGRTALLPGQRLGYARAMASDRMMQAIGTLERAVSRLEQDVTRLVEAGPAPLAR